MMKTIMSKTPHDSSFSFSRRFLNWKKKSDDFHEEDDYYEKSTFYEEFKEPTDVLKTKKVSSISKIKSALTVFNKSNRYLVTGTVFGHRRGHVHIAFQEDGKARPGFLIELPTPTAMLVREMGSGLVRIALECEKRKDVKMKLLEEDTWRTYCNGKKCGFAMKRKCGVEEWRVLKAVESVSMGAGVLPRGCEGDREGELMYMRATFERVVGSKHSEAFYMMNPDSSGGPELSVFLLRA